MFSIRTDLALEAAVFSESSGEKKLQGVRTQVCDKEDITITKVQIEDERGEVLTGKRKGNYITLECESLRASTDVYDKKILNAFVEELSDVIRPHGPKTIFVVGLGNRFVTPDSLGPEVVDNIAVDGGAAVRLCALSPGVQGITGIESAETVRGVAGEIAPDVIIVIDALASRSMKRICTTIQISDAGITPGSGVGNRQKEFTKEVMGVPVIAVGVPTVVDASTVASDSVDCIAKALPEEFLPGKLNLTDDRRYALIKQILSPYFGELIVTPSQIDCVIAKLAKLIADGINETAHNLGTKTI